MTEQLRPHERDTLYLVAMGYTDAEIAQRRERSVSTTAQTVRALRRKLGVRNRAQLLLYALRVNVVTLVDLSVASGRTFEKD